MKHILITLLIATLSTLASAQITIPALSPAVKITQTIGLTDITLDYSRPNQSDRVLFGNTGLVRNNEIWRTGANGATSIEISTDITIGSKTLPKGKYAILTTPGTDQWTFHFHKYASGNWASYTSQTPVIDINAKVENSDATMSSLLIFFDDITLDSGTLKLWWGTKTISMDVSVPVHDKVLSSINRAMSGPSTFDYFQAALYLHETNTNLQDALKYIQIVTKEDNAFFFQVYREALILKDLGQDKAALTAAKRSKALSEKAGNNDFIRLNEKLIDSLL